MTKRRKPNDAHRGDVVLKIRCCGETRIVKDGATWWCARCTGPGTVLGKFTFDEDWQLVPVPEVKKGTSYR